MNVDFPRVTLPGTTDQEQAKIDAVQAEMDWYTRTKNDFLSALLLKGPVFTGKKKPKRKPTKHQQGIASARLRSAYLKAA